MILKIKELILKNITPRQTVIKNIFWLVFGQTGSRLIKAVLIIYAARILGAEQYGLFSYVLGVAGFFTVFSDIGVSALLTREVARNPEKEARYFSTIAAIKAMLLTLTAGIIIFIAPYFVRIEAATALLPFIAVLIVFDNFRDLNIAFLRGKEKMETEAVIVILTNAAITLFGLVALYVWGTYQAFLTAYIIGSIFGFFVSLFSLKEKVKKIVSNFSKRLVLPILKSAWPFAAGGFIGSFMFNVDVIMLGWWRSAFEIGLYSAAQKLVGLLYNMSGFLAIATFPVFARYVHDGEREKIRNLTIDTIVFLFIVSIPIIIGGTVLRENIINFAFGEEYKGSVNVFIILLTSILIIFPFAILNNLLFVYDKQARMLGYIGIGSLVNVALNAILIPSYGIGGAAVATVLANAFIVAVLWRLIKKINQFTVLFRLPKILLASGLMGMATFSLAKLGIYLLINVAVSGAIYFLMLYFLKEDIIMREFSRFKLKFKRL